MEYDFYLEQKYLKNEGRVEARILTADQAEAMGYEDGYRSRRAERKLYVDGFESIDAIQNYVSDLVNCTLIESGTHAAHGQQFVGWSWTVLCSYDLSSV